MVRSFIRSTTHNTVCEAGRIFTLKAQLPLTIAYSPSWESLGNVWVYVCLCDEKLSQTFKNERRLTILNEHPHAAQLAAFCILASIS